MVSLSALSNHSLLCLEGDIHQRLQVIETEGGAVVPGTGLILEGPRECRGEEWALLTDILPDRGLDVATSQSGSRAFG